MPDPRHQEGEAVREISVRRATQDDAPQIVDWTADHVENPGRLTIPSSVILCAENGNPIEYAAIHPAAVIECLGPNPKANRLELALAVKALFAAILRMSLESGIPEVLCFTSGADAAIAAMLEKRGFQKLPWQAWRAEVGGHNEQGTEPGKTGATDH